MSRHEIMHTRLGEILELIDCHAIANGAEPKQAARERTLSYEEAIKVR